MNYNRNIKQFSYTIDLNIIILPFISIICSGIGLIGLFLMSSLFFTSIFYWVLAISILIQSIGLSSGLIYLLKTDEDQQRFWNGRMHAIFGAVINAVILTLPFFYFVIAILLF